FPDSPCPLFCLLGKFLFSSFWTRSVSFRLIASTEIPWDAFRSLRNLLADHFQFGPKGHKLVGEASLGRFPEPVRILSVIGLQGLSVLDGVLYGVSDSSHFLLHQYADHLGMGKLSGGQHIRDMSVAHPVQPGFVDTFFDIDGHIVYQHLPKV